MLITWRIPRQKKKLKFSISLSLSLYVHIQVLMECFWGFVLNISIPLPSLLEATPPPIAG